MANIDKVSVKNTVYNIVSPAVVSDYIEVIGGACTKPDGYVEDEVILAKQNDVQLLFKATQTIAFGANIVENTNCVRTTLEEVLKNAGGGGGASSADQVSYDNSDSGLEAENVQEAVDELATNAGTASSQIQTLTNNMQGVNLLDNPWFTVNQRGFSSFTSTASDQSAYTVDRWNYYFLQSGSSISLSNGVITLDNTNGTGDMFLVQKADRSVLEALHNKVITASVLFSDGTIEKGSIVYTGTNSQLIVKTGYIVYMSSYDSGGNELFVISTHPSSSISVRAVKLELGSVSTLAQDTAPNYAEELLKCQRYYQRIGKYWWMKAYGSNGIWLGGRFLVPMRAVPTITQLSVKPSFAVFEETGATNVSNVTLDTLSSTGMGFDAVGIGYYRVQKVAGTGTGDFINGVMYMALNDFLEVSADL